MLYRMQMGIYTPDVEEIVVLFARILPETILSDYMLEKPKADIRNIRAKKSQNDIFMPEGDSYINLLLTSSPILTKEEREERFHIVQEKCRREDGGVLTLPALFAKTRLREDKRGMVCVLEHLSDWNAASLAVGQDLITCAWLAWQDKRKYGKLSPGHRYEWLPIIGTDDTRLEKILRQGLAENHYHLFGSTQSFAVTWTVLMNHPRKVGGLVNDYIDNNLTANPSRGENDNVLGWEKRLHIAALIRVYLYRYLRGRCNEQDMLDETRRQIRYVQIGYDVDKSFGYIAQARFFDGKQVRINGYGWYCLDYCMDDSFCADGKSNARLLSGERSFLARCFMSVYDGTLGWRGQQLFYLYLLIKSHFRQEMIQTNHQSGFDNFSNYQDRKGGGYEDMKPYESEAIRLSMRQDMLDGNVSRLEARITPQKNYYKMFSWLDESMGHIHNGARHGYVVHFIKRDIDAECAGEDWAIRRPRNHQVRGKIYGQALGMARYLRESSEAFRYIRGIDAASREVRCRPETFATEFRFLRSKGKSWKGITYHAGEDFIDIIDGLRAIDEAMTFLEYRRGDRIGHGMALGIDAKQYYTDRRRRIVLPKQDLLDDLVWLYFKSLENDIPIASGHREIIKERAWALWLEIFGMCVEREKVTLRTYYESMKLRGDHPDVYWADCYKRSRIDPFVEYDQYKKRQMDGLENMRLNDTTYRIMQKYHFDRDVKRRSRKPESFYVEDWYIDAVSQMQRVMRCKISEKGIVLECNPTSNFLIGAFRDYTKHPIFLFNSHHLKRGSDEPQIFVTINTDDIGVFDTTLRNEYALVLAALVKKRHIEGDFDEETIYDYLEMIRENGHIASFISDEEEMDDYEQENINDFNFIIRER